MATFPRKPVYIRSDRDRIESEKQRLQIQHNDSPTMFPATAAGDPVKLRGIPAVGVKGGLGGAIPGTRP